MKKTKIRLSGHTTPTFLNSCSWVELRNGHPALERACTPSLLQAPALACCSPHGCQESGMTLQLSDNQGSLLLHQVTSPNDWPQSYGFDPTSPSAPYLHPLTKWKSYPVGFHRRQDLALPLSTFILSHCISLAKLEPCGPWTSLWVWGSAGQNRPYVWDLEGGREAAAMFLGSEVHTGPQAPWPLAQAASNLLVICIGKGSPQLLQISLCVFWSRARRACSSVVKHSSFSHRSPSAPRLEKVRDRHASNLSLLSPKFSFPFQASFRLTLGSTPDTEATAWTIS